MGRCDEDFKRAAVLDYLEGNRGSKTVAREHDIDPSLLRRWVEGCGFICKITAGSGVGLGSCRVSLCNTTT